MVQTVQFTPQFFKKTEFVFGCEGGNWEQADESNIITCLHVMIYSVFYS